MPGISRTCTVKSRGMIVVARELPAEQEEGQVVPTIGIDWITTVGDAQAGAGQQVVGQRVAGEAR